MDSQLVLDAAGISAEGVYRNGSWFLIVHRDDLIEATAELDAYRRENPNRVYEDDAPAYPGATTGVLAYGITIIFLAVVTAPWAMRSDWLPAGRMQAGKVMAGELWRTVTSLTLHLDSGHVAGNVVFGTVFGLLAGHALGGGVAWLTIVLAGATGNFINAMVQEPTHSSVGASTAVFAALGIIVSHSLRPSVVAFAAHETPIKRWSPLIGGVLLLAFVGVGGERTDVTAHVTGFLAGLVFGWGGSCLPTRWLASSTVQKSAGLLTLAIVAIAWMVGLGAI